MSDLKEKLKAIFLVGSKQSSAFFKGYRSFGYATMEKGNNKVMLLTMNQLKEIVNLFNEAEKRADNLQWRLNENAE